MYVLFIEMSVRMFSPQDNIDATLCIHYGTLFFLTRFISYNNFFISVTAITLPLTVTSSSLAISFRSIIFVTLDLLNSLGLKFYVWHNVYCATKICNNINPFMLLTYWEIIYFHWSFIVLLTFKFCFSIRYKADSLSFDRGNIGDVVSFVEYRFCM